MTEIFLTAILSFAVTAATYFAVERSAAARCERERQVIVDQSDMIARLHTRLIAPVEQANADIAVQYETAANRSTSTTYPSTSSTKNNFDLALYGSTAPTPPNDVPPRDVIL